MRIFAVLFFIIFSFNAYSQNYLDEIIDIEKKQFLASNRSFQSGVGNEYDLKYHRFYWEIDPAVNFIKGYVYSEFEVLASTDHIRFDFRDNMSIDSILFRASSIPYTLSNGVLDINLNVFLNPGEKDSIKVFYQGIPMSSGFGSWQYGSHNTGPIISTLSEPYGAMDWWPCKQSLNDKIDSVDVFLEIPDQYLAASNGVLKSTVLLGGNKKVMHWSHRYPIAAYLIAISVSNYVEFSNYLPTSNNDSLEILNYCFPQSLGNWQNLSTEIVPLLQLFDSLFEPYPFANEKYGHAEWELGGGMEHQTMSFMGSLNLGLMAHELAHQWFGDKITCASWKDIWLNEGFATYLTGLAFENGYGVGNNLWYNWRVSTIGSATSQVDGSVYVDDTSSVSRIFSGRLSYNKAALLLHMLRWKMGDDDFFGAIRTYLQDSTLAFSYANTGNLKYYLELESGMNLDEFFNDWFYGEGYPTYNLFLEKNQSGEYELTVNQDQSHSSVSFFEMPIAVEFRGLGFDSTMVFNHTTDGEVFTFRLPFEVWAYEFDPDLWICAKSTTTLAFDGTVSNNKIDVYPNPADELIFIDLKNFNERLSQIELLDYSGKVQNINPIKSETHLWRIPISYLPSGMYYLRISLDNTLIIHRFIVEK
ncbi:T9SS type A sorting domain-containing protein [Hyphobacterium sp. CCMP332]|nr:T9SS type A sorting domain-containing protein [Hyphobacterium sp. CCMP332]